MSYETRQCHSNSDSAVEIPKNYIMKFQCEAIVKSQYDTTTLVMSFSQSLLLKDFHKSI